MDNMVSVVVPVYNSEKLVGRCLDSLISQSYSNLQIIVVNDGSTDKSLDILKKYENVDNRIVVYNQRNSGVSVARNCGLKHAKGEFVLFVDSDDYILADTVETLMKNLDNNQDGIVFGYKLIGNGTWGSDTCVLEKIMNLNGNTTTAIEILKHVITIDPEEELLGYSVRYLYRNKILQKNSILFDSSLRISEDYKFIVEFLLHSRNIGVLNRELYIYDVNGFSATSRYMSTLNRDMNRVNQWIRENVYSLDPQIEREHQGCIANTYLNYVQNIAKKDSEYNFFMASKSIYEVKKKFRYSEAVKYTVKNLKCRPKAKLAFVLFSLNLDFIYLFLYYLKKRRE